MPKLRSWHLDWLMLLPLFLILTATRLAPHVLPIHDSMQVFQAFHYFYSSWFFDGGLPEWIPYGAYGMPFDPWASMCLTPASYLAASAGKLLGVTDVLLLFKLAMALEELVFLLGLYALCRLLFSDRSAVLFVCIGALLSLNWQFQLWWNFRLFYLVPAALAYLILFFQRGQAAYLWLAGATFAVSLVGNLPYYAPLYLFMTAVFAGLLHAQTPAPWRAVFARSTKNLAAFLLFAVMAGVYLSSVRAFMAPLTTSTGRDVESGGTSLGNFLTHGANPDVLDLFREALLGWPVICEYSGFPDQSVYIGLLSWFMLAWAALRVRSPLFLALAGTTLILLWMSAAGLFALAIFHLPTMAWFRHTSLVYNLCKPLLLICAGFGFQDFVKNARPWHVLMLMGVALFVTDSLMHIRSVLIIKGFIQDSASVSEWKASGEQMLEAHGLFVMRILLCLLAGVAILLAATREATAEGEMFRSPLLPVGLLAVYTFDMLSFMWASQYAIHLVPDELGDTLATLQAAPLELVERSERPPPGRGEQTARLVEFARDRALPGFRSGINQAAYGFMHQDPCRLELEPQKGVYFSPFHVKAVDRLLDPRLAESAADHLCRCEQPKLRVVTPTKLTANLDEFYEIVNSGADVGSIEVAGDEQLVLTETLVGASIRVRDFSANRLTVEVDRPGTGPAWLVYADADHPGWRVRVDGAESVVVRSCLAFKAVEVPAGSSVVELTFRPGRHFNPVYVAAMLAAIAWLALFPILLCAVNRPATTTPDPVG